MKKKKLKFTGAKFRREVRKFNDKLLSNMTFMNRIRYCFTGNYFLPLERTYKQLNRVKQLHDE